MIRFTWTRCGRGRIAVACISLLFAGLLPPITVAKPNAAVLANAPSTAARASLILTDALASKNPETRQQAVQAMGLIGPHEPYQSELTAMLGDSDVGVRVSTVFSLADLKDKSILPALRKALNDPVPEVSFAATRALWTMKQPDGRDALYAVLRGERAASSGYVKNEERAAMRAVHTPSQLIAFAFHEGIGLAHVPGLGTAISSAEGILSDENVSGRAAAALLIGKDDDPRAVPALLAALADKDASVRAAAVHALAVRDDPALEPDLRPMMDDKALPVRVRAAAACLRLELLPPASHAASTPKSAKKPKLRRATRSHRAH